jgi:hypothetical protein
LSGDGFAAGLLLRFNGRDFSRGRSKTIDGNAAIQVRAWGEAALSQQRQRRRRVSDAGIWPASNG